MFERAAPPARRLPVTLTCSELVDAHKLCRSTSVLSVPRSMKQYRGILGKSFTSVLDLKLILGCRVTHASVVVDVALRNFRGRPSRRRIVHHASCLMSTPSISPQHERKHISWSSIRTRTLLPLLGHKASSPNRPRQSRKAGW
jgi:hypothetical protein